MHNELEKVYAQLLGKALDIETALIEHLPTMIQNSGREDLKDILTDHLEETKQQKNRLDEIQSELTNAVASVGDQGFRQILSEAEATVRSLEDSEIRDMSIIASAQAVEHYEIATYETLSAWAEKLDEDDAFGLLSASLIEEETALASLEALASGSDLEDIIEDLTND